TPSVANTAPPHPSQTGRIPRAVPVVPAAMTATNMRRPAVQSAPIFQYQNVLKSIVASPGSTPMRFFTKGWTKNSAERKAAQIAPATSAQEETTDAGPEEPRRWSWKENAVKAIVTSAKPATIIAWSHIQEALSSFTSTSSTLFVSLAGGSEG